MLAVGSRRYGSWIADHNPFYLLSVVCMLFGCYALQNAMDVRAGELWKLIALLLATNAYEMLLVGLGYLLFVRRGLVRDAGYVLIAELLFLVDATFLNGETVTTNLWLGGAINLALLLLTVVKVWFVLRTVRVPNARRVLAFVILELAVLYIMPGFFRKLGPDGTVSAIAIYGMWWIVGSLPFVRDAILPSRPRATTDTLLLQSPFASGISQAYMIVPYLSLLAHLWIMHWVYEAPFYWADLTPVVLGLTLASRNLRPTGFLGARDLAIVRALLPIAAVLFSLENPMPLYVHVGMHTITPLWLAGGAAFLTCVYCFLSPFRLLALVAGAVAVLTFECWGWITQVGHSTADTGWQAGTWMLGLAPHSVAAWGMISVIGSFVLLAVGAWISIRKRPPLDIEHGEP